MKVRDGGLEKKAISLTYSRAILEYFEHEKNVYLSENKSNNS